MPAKAAVIVPTKIATRQAPSMPAATPPAIHCPRCATVFVAAITMPTTMPASMTSRKTMMSAATNAWFLLLHHQHAIAGVLMEIVEELVAAGRERANIDAALAVAWHHFFNPQRNALEFHRCGIKVLDPNDDRPVGRRRDLARLKTMVLDRDLHRHCFLLPARPQYYDETKAKCSGNAYSSTLHFISCPRHIALPPV